jgi:Co/Zn/Cd efflux system component
MIRETIFDIPKMDCPSEEGLVRMSLEGVSGVKSLSFDLLQRKLTVLHSGASEDILSKLVPLKFGARILNSQEKEDFHGEPSNSHDEAEFGVLRTLLIINASMFLIELGVGWVAKSAGLVADSLDMFADATVYGISLFAVARSLASKQKAARLSGYFQVCLALGGFAEVARRYFMGSEPVGLLMMGMATLALLANGYCLFLLAKHRNGEVHMKASWIFSTNDVIANVGVIAAGLMVWSMHSQVPDLVIGLIICTVVLSGALRILRVARASDRA